MNPPVWFVTGCSTGFGREIVKQLLAEGIRTVVTARRPDSIADLVEGHEDTALALELDVTKPEQIESAVAQAEAHFGRIDVLVNNAGYGYFAAIEEGEDAEIRRQFEVNVFGLAALTRRVLPGMRARRGFVRLLGPECYDPLSWFSGGEVCGMVGPKAERVSSRMTV